MFFLYPSLPVAEWASRTGSDGFLRSLLFSYYYYYFVCRILRTFLVAFPRPRSGGSRDGRKRRAQRVSRGWGLRNAALSPTVSLWYSFRDGLRKNPTQTARHPKPSPLVIVIREYFPATLHSLPKGIRDGRAVPPRERLPWLRRVLDSLPRIRGWKSNFQKINIIFFLDQSLVTTVSIIRTGRSHLHGLVEIFIFNADKC